MNIKSIMKNKEETKMSKWSLRKKVLIGMGIIGTAAIGAIAYSKCNEEDVIYDEELEELEGEFGQGWSDEDSDDSDDEENETN